MSKGTFERTKGIVGHVDHGKTTLTAAITFTSAGLTGRDLREAVGDVSLSVLSPENQERIREAARKQGFNPDRIYFVDEAIYIDHHVSDEEYNRAEREAHITGGRLYGEVWTNSPAVDIETVDSQPLKKQWEESSMRYASEFLTESYPVSPKGKQGKNKSTRRFPLPNRGPR